MRAVACAPRGLCSDAGAEDAAADRAAERTRHRTGEDERPVREHEPQDPEHEVGRGRADAGGTEEGDTRVEEDTEHDGERSCERRALAGEPTGTSGREHDVRHREVRPDADPVGDA